MDPMTMAALANIALQVGGQIMNQGNKDTQTGLSQAALAQQRADAARQYQFATATRTDPYGNQLIYTPGLGWHYKLTDITRGTLAAQQGEAAKSVSEDATRNRQLARREEGVSRAGEAGLYRTLNEAQYGPRPSEAGSIADLTREIMLARDRGAREPTQAIGRQAIRGLANPNVLTSLLRQSQEGLGGSLEEAVLRGRRLGKQEFQSDTAARDKALQNWATQYGNIFNQQTRTPIVSSNVTGPDTSGAINDVMQALQNASTGQQTAMSRVATASGQQGFDLGAIGPSILALGKIYAGNQTSDPTNPASWSTTVKPDPSYAVANPFGTFGYNPYLTTEEDLNRKATQDEFLGG